MSNTHYIQKDKTKYNITNTSLQNIDESSFIKKLNKLYSYFLEFMTYIELSYYDDNEDQLELFIKTIERKCDPINDKSSCLWAISRCFTFSSITKRLFNVNLKSKVQFDSLFINRKIKGTINFINISLNPDHVFNLIKIGDCWYYISSWMLLYSGVIMKIDDIESYLNKLYIYFIKSNFKKNRKQNYTDFISYIETFFIYKLEQYGDNNTIKINNFSLINQLIHRTGENMIEQMLNLIKVKKDKIVDNKVNKYNVYFNIGYINNIDDINIIYDNFYEQYIKKCTLNTNNNYINTYFDEYFALKKYSKPSFFKTLDTMFNNEIVSNNKYINKIIKLILTDNKKFNELYQKIISKHFGGNYSIKYKNDDFQFMSNSHILNNIFMGNIIKLHNPGFEIKNEDGCNIINIVRYANLLKHLVKENIFENICYYLFKHYDELKTYIITKKFYCIKNKNDKNKIGELCILNISDHDHLYSFIILNINDNINIIFPELIIIDEKDIIRYVYDFIATKKSVQIIKIQEIILESYKIDTVEDINYCKILNNLKQNFMEYINKYNIIDSAFAGQQQVYILLFIIYGFYNNMFTNILITKFDSLDALLSNSIIFDIVYLLFDDNIKDVSYTYNINIGTIFYTINEYTFFKELYLNLKRL
jgi:hypothetical protein